MKKQSRHFLILAIVLVVLVGGYFGLTQYNSRQQEQQTDQTEGEVLVDISRDEILRFSYVYDGETCSFEKSEVPVEVQEDGSEEGNASDGDGGTTEPQTESRWIYEGDASLNLMQSRLNTMAGKLTNIVAEAVIDDVTDMSQYGLEEPSNVLHWETGQESYTYNVGDYNSIAGIYYICEPDSQTVYTVTTSLGTGFSYSLEDLVEEQTDEPEDAATTE